MSPEFNIEEVYDLISILRLINIQSYEDVTFRLSDGVNVLTAPNETGKSVMFKVFRQMCNGNWYGRGTNKSLIRRGASKGTALLVVPYENGLHKIVFEVYPTYQIYRLFDGDTPVCSWQQDSLPDDIAEILGWYYDRDSKILLNLCDQELDMPFVNSNESFNYEALRFVLLDPELERARFNIGEWLYQLSEKIDIVATRKTAFESLIKGQTRVDTVALENSIKKREKLVGIADVACELVALLDSCCELEKPSFNTIDTESVDASMDAITGLRDLGLVLQQAITEKKPEFNKIDGERVEGGIQKCKALQALRSSLVCVLNDMDKYKALKMKVKNAKECIQRFEEEHEFCPLCGSRFGGEHCE